MEYQLFLVGHSLRQKEGAKARSFITHLASNQTLKSFPLQELLNSALVKITNNHWQGNPLPCCEVLLLPYDDTKESIYGLYKKAGVVHSRRCSAQRRYPNKYVTSKLGASK